MRIEIISETSEGEKSRLIITAKPDKKGDLSLNMELDPPIIPGDADAHKDPLGIQEAAIMHIQELGRMHPANKS